MRKTVKATLVAAAVAGVLTSSAGAAFADDCFNASRSAKGNVSAATHSGNWYSLRELLGFFQLTPDQVDAVMAVVDADPRIPANLTLFFVPAKSGNVEELAHNLTQARATDGKGIDHSDDYPGLFDALDEDLATALGWS